MKKIILFIATSVTMPVLQRKKTQDTTKKILLMVVCVLWAGALRAQNEVTLRPVDTGRSVTFYIGANNASDRFALKTNLLYGAALSPNLSLEAGLGEKTSLEIAGGFSFYGKKRVADGDIYPDNKLQSFRHFSVKPEFRYWLRERFSGHFAGVHAFYADYEVSDVKIPLLFEKGYHYDGYGFGGGITYGYLWRWGSRWGMEFHIGAGALQMKYEKRIAYEGNPDKVNAKKTYIGPTNAGIKLFFMIK